MQTWHRTDQAAHLSPPPEQETRRRGLLVKGAFSPPLLPPGQMTLHRLVIFGILTSVLTLSILGLFFFDINLPTELHAFKLATQHRLKGVSGAPSTGEGGEFRILPVGLPSTSFDDEIEDSLPDKLPPASPNIPSQPAAGPVPDYVDIEEESDYGSPDFEHLNQASTSFSMSLTSSLETTVPNGAIINGFSLFDNLVMHNGTFYIVTRNRTAFPKNKEDIVGRPWVSGQVERDPHEEVRT